MASSSQRIACLWFDHKAGNFGMIAANIRDAALPCHFQEFVQDLLDPPAASR
jgi:hypothetical protein